MTAPTTPPTWTCATCGVQVGFDPSFDDTNEMAAESIHIEEEGGGHPPAWLRDTDEP